MEQLSPLDAAFLYLENEGTLAHGTFVWIYDAAGCDPDHITRKALLDHMRNRIELSTVFTHKIYRLPLDFDYPYWVRDESFELLYHVRELSLPENATWNDFRQLVSQVHSQGLSREHPLWEMTLVRGLNGMPGLPETCFAILGKFHHVAIDGATGMQIIGGIHDRPGASAPSKQAQVSSSRQPRLSESLYRAAIRNVGALDKTLGLLGAKRKPQTSQEEPETREEPIEGPDEPAGIPQTLFNTAVEGDRTWDSRAFDLESIKSMRRAVPGATVNDVLLTICAGGLREFLEEQDALPGAPMKAGCPINIRTEGEAAAGGNMISAMIVNLHTDIADPIKRLKAIAASSAASKHRAAQRGDRKILDIAAIVPAQAQALLGHAVGLAARRMNKALQFNCSISNLPGPQIELRMLGGKLVSIGAAMPVMNGYGLFIGLTTCAGRLNISMSSATNVMADPGELGDCMERSYQALLRATKRKKTARRKAS